MSKNNSIRKSDKKFIRREKARIRKQFLDVKKQQEMINELYVRFLPKEAMPAAEVKEMAGVVKAKDEVKKPKASKKEKITAKK